MDTKIANGKPHYLLFFQTARSNKQGQWRFVLKEASGKAQFQVGDEEPGVFGERLDLLTIIRALESLDQPSRVTLTSCSAYLRQGIEYGISDWRTNKWQWEFFGYMVPVKHADLWQRMDRLLNVHSVECRQLRFDEAHRSVSGLKLKQKGRTANWGIRVAAEIWLKYALSVIPGSVRQHLAMTMHNIQQRLSHLRHTSKPCPGSS